ncbi:MAG: hypothetical protein ACFFEO_10480 [Candidatus Thorarchaeota archaeon]
MITTRESINYQFSLIFGYSSPTDLICGDVIGPGRLTRDKVNALSRDVIRFLTMYNAILEDYAGAEVFSIEFELYNIDEKSATTKIYPKSMIFIPGKFKDCESLVLALKPETGYLDVHKSRNSINNISKLFYEVEEFADHPKFSDSDKQLFYNKFATRFSKKLFGDLLEDKWNKKLIGLSTSLPTEKEMLSTYAKIISDVEILLYKKPIEINLSEIRFEKINTPFDGQGAVEHLKYAISEPSAKFIVDRTLNLGTSLINLANMGTLDEFQDDIISFFITRIEESVKKTTNPQSGEWLVSYINRNLLDLEGYVNKFLEYSNIFLTSGEMGDLTDLMTKYEQFIANKGKLESEVYEEITRIAIKFIKQSIIEKGKLRVTELSSVLNYFSEINKRGLSLIRTSLPSYLSRRRLKSLTIELFKNLTEKFMGEQKPAKILGLRLIEKFKEFLFNQIELKSISFKDNIRFDEKMLIDEFIRIVNTNIDSFFGKVKLNIEDLISFAEIQMENESNTVKIHIEKLKKYSKELNYLLSYILRFSTINRFIKDELDNQTNDPVSFANKFHRFLEKRVGGINLEWKSYVLQWIIDYGKQFMRIEDQKNWLLPEIYKNFLEYVENREANEQKLENFLGFMDSYIAGISNMEEKKSLLEFYKQYEYSIRINEEFPKYVKNKIHDYIRLISLQIEELPPIIYFSFEEDDNFYNYIKQIDLKYFSKLIPRPLSLILKQHLTAEESELFKGDLFHVINFKFWHDNVRFELSDNFREVYREWMKEI